MRDQAKEPEPLTFMKVWRELEKEFGKNIPGHHRLVWERVTLNGEQNLTYLKFREFQREFMLTLKRAEDVTDEEAERKLMQELPDHWRSRVIKEGVKRAGGQYWVRIPKPTPIPLEELMPFIEIALMKTRPKVEEQRLGYLIECGSEVAQAGVLTLNGYDFGVGELRVIAVERRMTVQEIFSWLAEKLRLHEKETEYGRGLVHAFSSTTEPPLPSRLRRRIDRQTGGRPLIIEIPR